MKHQIVEIEDRYFAGIEHHLEIDFGIEVDISSSWKKMFNETYNQIKMKTSPHQMIGLACYSIDFDETNKMSYYVLAETIDLIEQDNGIVTKKIPKGRYICFDISNDHLGSERRKVYRYCRENKINVHMGFDFEYYLNEVDYEKKEAILELCLKLEDD